MPDAPNPYATPQADLPLRAPSRSELRAFAGMRADYFVERWDAESERAWGFNLGALLFGALYLLFRKLYAQCAVLVGLLILWGIAEEFVRIPAGLNLGLQAALYLFLGWKANDWYLQLALDKIAAAKSEGHEGEELHEVLRKRGGVNLWAPLLLAGGIVALFVFLPG